MAGIAFRADASVAIGSGHVKRCLALALAAGAAGLEPVLVCRDGDGTARSLLAHAGVEAIWLPEAAEDADATADALASRDIAWVVVDHYRLDAAWHDAVRSRLGCRIAAIDDLADRPLAVDLLVDVNDVDAGQSYAALMRRPGAVLGGPRYALLDPAYAVAPRHAFRDPVRSIGIFMGGTDPTGACVDALAACRDAGFTGEVEVVCSRLAPRFQELAAACTTRPDTRVLESLPRLDDFHARHDLLLGAGGGASWERCCIGTPTIACMTADNQHATLPRLERLGAVRWARDAGRGLREAIATQLAALLAEPVQRRALGEAARTLVDGHGSARVAAVFACAAGAPLRVRPAGRKDEQLTLDWANDPMVRAQGFHPGLVDAARHSEWFHARLADPDRRLVIAEAPNGIAVGQVRLERVGAAWEIGYLLDPAFRGFGLAVPLLTTACASVPEAAPLVARVRPANQPSLRVFRRLGFDEHPAQDERGPHVLFRREAGLRPPPATMPHADR